MKAITPDRSTVVTLDTPDTYITERSVYIEKSMDEIADGVKHNLFFPLLSDFSSSPLQACNVAFSPWLGWTLGSQIQATDYGFETSSWDPGRIPLMLLTLVNERATYRANTDLPGVGIGTNQQATGRPRYQLDISADNTFDTELSADRAAYPPATMHEIQPLKRRAVSINNVEPTDHLIYSIEAPIGGHSAVSRIYFTSIAGSDPSDGTLKGTGQYHLTLYAHGLARLHERLENPSPDEGEEQYTWKDRFSFDWFNGGTPTNIHHILVIYSDAVKDSLGNYSGTKIMFRSINALGNDLWMNWRLNADRDPSNKDKVPVYFVSNPDKYQPHLEKFRLDERRDVRSLWFVETAVYYNKGYLVCNAVDVKYPISNTEPLYVEWFGYRPPGTTISIDLIDAETGTSLPPSGLDLQFAKYGVKGFLPASGRVPDTSEKKYARTKYQAIVTLSTSNSKKTPVINKMRYYRKPIWKQAEGDPIELPLIQSISITGQDSDPTHETACIQCADLKGELTKLQTRAGMATRIDVRYDPADPTKVSNLFTGYVSQALRTVRGGASGGVYPVDGWASYDIRCSGEWQRLLEAKATQTWDFTIDVNTNDDANPKPWKITDVIRFLISDAGYEDENIEIPDIDIRLFPSGDPTKLLRVEMMSEIFPIVSKLAMMYLGAWLEWDGNASNAEGVPHKMGCWRLHQPPEPDDDGNYTNLAHFRTTPQLTATTGIRMRYAQPYQKTDGTGDEQKVQFTWVKKNSFTSYVVPPEGNAVYVTGIGINGSLTSGIQLNPMSQIVKNYRAAKFSDDDPPTDSAGNPTPDPNHPDYTNGRPVWIVITDGSLWSQRAVDFYARRVFDIACHAQKRLKFTAPLLLVWNKEDQDNGIQRQPRPLKFGDPVLFNDQQFIVANVNPDYSATQGGSRAMMASYELFSPANLSDWKTAGNIQ